VIGDGVSQEEAKAIFVDEDEDGSLLVEIAKECAV
jgi:hypothetical protein